MLKKSIKNKKIKNKIPASWSRVWKSISLVCRSVGHHAPLPTFTVRMVTMTPWIYSSFPSDWVVLMATNLYIYKKIVNPRTPTKNLNLRDEIFKCQYYQIGNLVWDKPLLKKCTTRPYIFSKNSFYIYTVQHCYENCLSQSFIRRIW